MAATDKQDEFWSWQSGNRGNDDISALPLVLPARVFDFRDFLQLSLSPESRSGDRAFEKIVRSRAFVWHIPFRVLVWYCHPDRP
jgi:hypothetical protein